MAPYFDLYYPRDERPPRVRRLPDSRLVRIADLYTETEMIECLLPHVRQYVRVRQALVDAEARRASLSGLLDNTRVGVIHLDRQGRISEANDRAHDILRRGDGLLDRGGLLRAWLPTDNANLKALLARALPASGAEAVSGSMTVRRAQNKLLPRRRILSRGLGRS